MFRNCQLHLRYLFKAKFMRRFLLDADVVIIPLLITEGSIKLAVLPGEILVVQVQPVVFGQIAFYYFFVINHIIRDLGIF